jgi:hypothetical protein
MRSSGALRRLVHTLLIASLSPGLAMAAVECGPERLTIDEGQAVRGPTSGVPISCVIEEIARQTGAEVRGTADDVAVTFDLTGIPLGAALARLLEGRSYFLLFREGRLARISLLGDRALVAHASPTGSGGSRTDVGHTVPPAADDAVVGELRSTLLENPHVGDRKAALDRLQSLPRAPTELLAKVAREDFDPGMRRQALFVIAALGELDGNARSAAEVLQRNDPDRSVREAAAAVLRTQARRGMLATQ